MPIAARVMLLALNRLPARPNNAYVKIFASRKRQREAGFASLDKSVLTESSDLRAYVLGLRETLNVKGEWDMAQPPTPEQVLEYGKKIRQLIFETGTSAERLEGLPPHERLAGLPPHERLAGLSPHERLAGLSAEERRALLRLLQEEMDDDAKDHASGNGNAA